MAKFGFLIDNRKCIGCHACTVACKQEHDVPLGEFRTWVKYVESGDFPATRRQFSVMRCNHCDNPPCVYICPVTALFKRDDGIVDFDPQVCIGCKSCMAACPYDALFIEPESGSAHKCNFCAHRIEVNREPPCVTVCPEQAIVMGDLDDPESPIRKLIKSEKAKVRSPEQRTTPKLFYVEGTEASLSPLAAPPQASYMWSETRDKPIPLAPGERAVKTEGRRTYDISHPAPWGWKVSAYLWTKSLASGCFVVPWVLGLSDRLVIGTALALFFLLATTILLVWDLKRPRLFFTILTRPQWKSWITLGAFVLTAYGGLLTLILALWAFPAIPRLLVIFLSVLTLPVAVMAAAYTGYLFLQCEARDLWQSQLMPLHLTFQAFLAGSATMLLLSPENMALQIFLAATLLLDLAVFFPYELGRNPHHTPQAREAAGLLTRGVFKRDFWAGVVIAGRVIPLLLLPFGGVIPAILALLGLLLYEHRLIVAGQAIPLS